MPLFAALVAVLVPSPALACAVCGCTLTSDWLSQGFATMPGTTLVVRYDLADQNQLYSGSHRLHLSSIALPSDDEVEVDTQSHVLNATFDHQFASDFGLNISLPYIWRTHDHIEAGDIEPTHYRTHGLGDLSAVARWTGLSKPGSLTGLQGGVVFPTGHWKGGEVERGVMPGSGTMQLVAGAFQAGRLSPTVDYALQVTGQTPVGQHSGFKPASFVQASASFAYTGWRGVTPQIQLNGRVSGREHGPEADHDASGGEQLLIAPGATVNLSSRIAAFAFVEHPIYTRVNAEQVVAPIKASFGLQLRI